MSDPRRRTGHADAELEQLAARAHGRHVVVVGGGVAGLVAALECAKVGLRVTVLERAGRAGGVVRAAELDGLVLDVGAESFATRDGAVRALVDELGLGDAVVAPEPRGAWVAGLPGPSSRRSPVATGSGAAPLPAGGVLGIPGNPWAPEVRRVIGWGGAWRAYLDRLRPPLTIGHRRSLGELVRARQGERVLQRLVAPVTSGVYSARPDDIDVDLAAPGLNAALTRTGSLGGAVLELRGGRATAPGGAVQGLEGGMTRLVDALVDRLRDLGAEVRTGLEAVAVARRDDGWTVETAPVPGAAGPAGEPIGAAGPAGEPIAAAAVVVAADEATARTLLAPVVPGLEPDSPDAPVVEVVTFVVDAPALDAAPRGSGVLTVPGSSVAKALTHSTAKWRWLAARAGAGRHVVRVSFGAQGERPVTEELGETDAVALAVREAAGLLGVPLDPARVRAGRRERYAQAQPAATIGRAARTAAAREAIGAVGGLGATGAWLAGTGLAQVVPDARAVADRIRRGLLWDGGAR